MIVGDLLRLEDLRIEVAWATPELLDREVTGVTSTDLQDPARYLRPGELVLTGLVWWRPDDLAADPVAAARAAGRFATALRSAEAAALLAGEGTHGAVPSELAQACRRHGIPLLAVPAGTSFRAVTDRVYLRLWGDLQLQAEGAAAVPAAVRRELLALLQAGAEPSALLSRAVSDLGLPHCSLRTTSGRLLGTSAPGGLAPVGAPGADRSGSWAVPVGGPGLTPFDGWLLQPHTEPAPAAAAVLRGLADLLAPLAARARSTAAAQRQSATRVVDLLRAPRRAATAPDGREPAGAESDGERYGPAGVAGPHPGRPDGTAADGDRAATRDPAGDPVGTVKGAHAELDEALRSCGLPDGVVLTPVVARSSAGPSSWAAAALAEALQGTGAPFVVAPDPGAADRGSATGLCAAPEAAVLAALQQAWPRLRALLAGHLTALHPAAAGADRTAVRSVTAGAGARPVATSTGVAARAATLTAAAGPRTPASLPALRAAVVQTDWILSSYGEGADVAGISTLDSLAALLRGVPEEVRAAYRERLLGPLVAHDRVNGVSLLGTLAVFLELDGSWSRAARALHVHVNTVHYRVRRIEELTGRNLARLEDRADLRAALLCEPLPG